MAHETFERGGRASVSEGLCMERVLTESAVSSGQTIGVTRSATDPASMSAPRQHAEGGGSPWDRVATKRSCVDWVPVRLAGLNHACGRSSILVAWLISNQLGRQDNDHPKD